MKKKVVSLALVVCLLAVAIVGGTLAYFADTDTSKNVITIGDVSAWLAESKYHRGATGDSYLKMDGQPENLTDADIIADSETYHSEYLRTARLMPFDLTAPRVQDQFEECTVAKNAYVMNTGLNDCYVRVSYLIPVEIAEYLDIFYTDTQFVTEVPAELNNDDRTEPMITTVNSSAANAAAQIGTKTEDGKYYIASFIYAERLTSGEMTLYSPISKITLVPTVTEATMTELNLANRQFEIQVTADVIQAAGFVDAVEAFAAFDAQNQ